MSHVEHPYLTAYTASASAWDPYPETRDDWSELYDQRERWYTMARHPDVRGEGLFAEVDDQGNGIGETRPIFRVYGFVADTDAAALHGGGLVLDVSDTGAKLASSSALLTAGEAVWRRSRMPERMPRLSRLLCALGDRWIEPVRMRGTRPHRTTLVDYDPRHVLPVYDRTGMELERVVITIDTTDQPIGRGESRAATARYVRTLTRDEIIVTINGVVDPTASGPHGLGVVPIVHLQALPWEAPEYGLPAPHGVERGIMLLDSMWSQVHAIGRRHAHPTPWLKGMGLGSGANAGRLGRWIEMPAAPGDVDLGYLETKLDGSGSLRESVSVLLAHLKETCPEFLFSDTSAAESGVARSLRGNAFEAKIREMRATNLGAMRRAVEMAVALDGLGRYDPDADLLRLDAPPILPRNVAAELEQYALIRADLRRSDRVRWLQRLGLVGAEHDPDEYAAEVEDERGGVATFGGVTAGAEVETDDDETEAPDDGADGAE